MINTEKIWNKKFILLFITNLLMMAAFYASIPIVPIYAQQIGITGSKIGLVLTTMSVATVLFRPVAGYLLDNFNRYRVYILFLGLFCLAFPSFILFPIFGALILIRLYMGVVYSVCGSATMTLAGDVLPRTKVTEGISRFALTISIGMALGPFVGIQVQNHLSSKTSFMVIFAITVIALICVAFCKIPYPKVARRKFSLREAFYKPALPFSFNMMFLMIPFGAVIAYSSMLAQEKNLTALMPYFYICLVVDMLVSKFSTQKLIDAGKHRPLVYLSLIVLTVTMISYAFLSTGWHLLLAGFLFGLGYGILQPLFQAFVTGTTPAPKRGVANATYMLSYDIGIGLGSLIIGFLQESVGLSVGFSLTAISFVIGGLIYALSTNRYYLKLKASATEENSSPDFSIAKQIEADVYSLPTTATIRDALNYFSQKHISGAPILAVDGTLAGFISDGDIIRYLREDDYPAFAVDGSSLFMETDQAQAEFEQKLDTIMNLSALKIGVHHVISLTKGATFQDAIKLLSEEKIKKIPIVDHDKVVGILSRSRVREELMGRYLAGEHK